MTIWTRNKVQGTRHKIQELLTTHSNLPVTINPKFEFRNPNLQHPASNLKPQTSNLKLQTSNITQSAKISQDWQRPPLLPAH